MKIDPKNLTDLEKALLEALGWTPLLTNLEGFRGDVLDSDWLQSAGDFRSSVERQDTPPWEEDPASWSDAEFTTGRVIQNLGRVKQDLISALSTIQA